MSIFVRIKAVNLKLLSTILALALLFSVLAGNRSFAQDVKPTYLYKTTLLRAAPGKLTELITLLKGLNDDGGYYDMLKVRPPFIMRHSQGDQWDLLLLYPIGSYQSYYNNSRSRLRRNYKDTIDYTTNQINARVAFKEDLFAYGPNVKLVEAEYAKNNLFHIEMFSALAGQHDALLKERHMENDYLKRTGQKPTLIWVGDQGADYDSFTIGFHESLQTYAHPGPATEAEKKTARIAAGFPEFGDDIGAYLRRFLASHHDTLATAVR